MERAWRQVTVTRDAGSRAWWGVGVASGGIPLDESMRQVGRGPTPPPFLPPVLTGHASSLLPY